MVFVRKDEVDYLQKNGLGKYIIAKTCYGKKFAEENRHVLEALKNYNALSVVEDKK